MEAVINHNGQDQKIFDEQIRLLYQVMKPILIGNFVVSSALLYGFWDVVSHTTLMVWMSVMLLMLLLRGVHYFSILRNFTTENVKRYSRHFVIGNAVAGLFWGISGLVLFPDGDLQHQLIILFVLLGFAASGAASLTVYLPAFFTFLPLSMLPITINLVLASDPIHQTMGFMTMAVTSVLLYFGIGNARNHKTSLKLRFENIELAEQLRQQKEEADHANQSKSKFLAAASHDLRQPLHALTLFTSVLDESIQYPKVRRVVDQIKASVGALQNLFNALLDISRLDAGVMQVEKSDFLLQPLLDKLINDFDPQAHEKGLDILWPTCPYAIHTDQNLLEQILRNYISNAIRYTESGEIRITSEANESKVTISVIDTGRGIPEEEQQVIFEEFHQLNNPERDRSKGLGLGLAIVQRTANLLGHTIGIKSQPGKGSTFSIRVDQATMVESANVAALEIEDDIQQADNPLMIVIDDEVSVREGTQNLLELWNYSVITAADKDEAIAQLRQQDRIPDGIIADLRLRENNTGIEAIHAIHAEYNRDIPALIVTGDIAPDRLREVTDSGFQMLHKPVAPARLRAFLRHVQVDK